MSIDTRYLPNTGLEHRGRSGLFTPRRFLLLAIVLILVAVAYFGSRGDDAPTQGSHVEAVSIALTRSGFTDVEVSADEGVIVLSGSASSEQDQYAIGRVARSVDDVIEIDNRVTTAEVVEEAAPVGAATAPAIELQARLSEAVARDPIVFASASPDIVAESLPGLDTIATILNEMPDHAVQVGGHTDADGEEAENLTLSEQRAQAVVSYLEEQGVEPGRLTAVGFGESVPIADNETGEGKERNRRIEFRIVT